MLFGTKSQDIKNYRILALEGASPPNCMYLDHLHHCALCISLCIWNCFNSLNLHNNLWSKLNSKDFDSKGTVSNLSKANANKSWR